MSKYLFSSESVTDGHPDKVCDAIADTVLDTILESDPNARVASECAATTGMVLLMGEVTTDCYVDIPRLVRDVVIEIGYDRPELGFDGNSLAVISAINSQSPDIDMGVSKSFEAKEGADDEDYSTGAGDQGMMFGYACYETPEYMPMPIALALRLTHRLRDVRRDGTIPFLRPDGKAQVTVEYEDDKPVRVDTVVVSAQHNPDVELSTIREEILERVIKPIIPASLLDEKTTYYINPTGRFVIGGPQGDSGLTGRKIVVDTCGGCARHGGGSFSGEDCGKVDRSAAYAARYVAKNIVAAGLAKRCEIQIAYAIGVANPVSVMVDTQGTGIIPDERITEIVLKHVDLRPAAIIKHLNLRAPVYKKTAAFGHFGRNDAEFSWERLDLVDEFKKEIGG